LAGELASSLFSSRIVYRESIDSTNDLAKQLAAEGAPEGTLILAEEQTVGRGRRGRAWHSPPGANLLFTVLLRPAVQSDRVFALTMILVLAAMEALKRLTGLAARIKWPNDLYAGRRKLAGILTEFSMTGRIVDWVALGLGLNVSWYPEGLSAQATSILEETGTLLSRNRLLVETLREFEGSYREILAGKIDPFYKKWNEACFILGKMVVIDSEKERLAGKAVRIEPNGTLLIETGEGDIRRVVAGDVSLRLKASMES
jgi:BirA family biotin operon repressor/biotin-[acetyl-CoA-carboxylase] ligase